MFTRLTLYQAQATSLGAIIPTAVVGALLYYFGSGRPQVDLRFALLLVIGSVVGVYLGARAMSHLPERQLRRVFAILLVLLGVKQLAWP